MCARFLQRPPVRQQVDQQTQVRIASVVTFACGTYRQVGKCALLTTAQANVDVLSQVRDIGHRAGVPRAVAAVKQRGFRVDASLDRRSPAA